MEEVEKGKGRRRIAGKGKCKVLEGRLVISSDYWSITGAPHPMDSGLTESNVTFCKRRKEGNMVEVICMWQSATVSLNKAYSKEIKRKRLVHVDYCSTAFNL